MSTSKPAWSERELPAFFTRWRTDWKGEVLAPDNFLDFEGGLRFVLAAPTWATIGHVSKPSSTTSNCGPLSATPT